jgi:hypothetical protein
MRRESVVGHEAAWPVDVAVQDPPPSVAAVWECPWGEFGLLMYGFRKPNRPGGSLSRLQAPQMVAVPARPVLRRPESPRDAGAGRIY